MHRFRYFFILLSLIAFGSFVFLFVYQTNQTEANKHEFWIAIGEKELNSIRQNLTELKLDVKDVQNGIALVHTTNGDLERLSGEMHKHFHKCPGFTAHQTKNEALSAIESTFAENRKANLVEYTINNQANVNQLLTETQEPNIKQTILDLSAFPTRRHDQPQGQNSANFIKDKWTELANGRSDITVEFFNHPANVTPQPSIILTIQGTTTPDEIVVLGGHQDSIFSGNPTGTAPGADDNASGIASLTEAIRILIAKNYRPAKTVKFMAYAAEEVGLRGSNDIATKYKNDNINVIGVMQLDMTNFQGSSGIDFAFESDTRFINTEQTQFLKDLVQEYLPNMTTADFRCNYGCSDHASWHRQGFPASFPFEAPFGEHNSQIHTPGDIIARSDNNATHAEKFTKLALAFVGELAKGSVNSAPQTKAKFDFDGDNKTDISIFRPDAGEWWYLRSSDNGNGAIQFGQLNDTLTPADYTGDGKTDISFWRESTKEWFVLRSENNTFFSFPFGTTGDIPAPADYDGDNKDDVAVYRPDAGTWFINQSSNGETAIIPFGIAEDKPVIADYDGDGKADIAIYRPSVSEWWINQSRDGVTALQFGSNGDKTVPGDFTGDGKADVAFFRPTTGEWFIIRSNDNSFFSFPFGTNGDMPTPGDYDGDGKIDATVFRPSDSTWYMLQTTNGFGALGFGTTNDYPVPNSFVAE